MYWRRFNLTGEPFSLTPDPAFLYLSSVHAEAYAALTMGLKERRGLISMIGEVGTGKTTLVYSLLSSLGPEIHTAYISNARLSFDGILRNALRDFGIECDELHGVQLLDAFNEFLHNCAKAGTTAALVIDEAQNLSHDTFEDLRLLSNFETYKTKLLQIVLVGQPELDTKLRDPALRQVAERIAVRTHVNPLTSQETRHYIEHRLAAVGGSIDIFSEPAIRTITSRSAGIPRAINILCHNAMLFAYGQAKDKIARSMVLEAVHEKEGAGLVRLGTRSGATNLPSMTLNTPAWTWNAVFLILAVGLSIAMIRVAGNIRFAPAQPQTTAIVAEPLPSERQAQAQAQQAQVMNAGVDAARAGTVEDAIETAPVVQAVPTPEPVVAAEVAAEPTAAEPEIAFEQPAAPAIYKPVVDEPAPQAIEQAAAPVAAVPAVAAPVQLAAADERAAEAVARPEINAPAANAPHAASTVDSMDTIDAIDAIDSLPPASGAYAILTEPTVTAPTGRIEIELDPATETAHADGTTLALLDADSTQPSDSTYQIIDVEPGNSLSDLMIAIYGHYTNTMVQRVQALNPQITDPNIILAGDALRFPSEWKIAFPSSVATDEEVVR